MELVSNEGAYKNNFLQESRGVNIATPYWDQ